MGVQLAAAAEAQTPHVTASSVKVHAHFWNSRTGETESVDAASNTAKRKHQINTLAASAAAMESDLARARAASYAKRDTARKKYGW